MPLDSSSPYALLASACQRDAARPSLTWYDNDTGERAELSGATLLNWVNKTANFMIDELSVQPGVSISLQLPRHWLTAAWWLAALTVGAQPQIGQPRRDGLDLPAGNVDIAVFGPDAVAHLARPIGNPPQVRVEHQVAVALTPMAIGIGGALPAGIIDFEVEVRSQPDAFMGTDEGDPALGLAAADRARAWSLTSSDRLMAAGPWLGEDDLVRDLLAPLAGDASCVWVRNPDPVKDVQLAVAEHVTVTTMGATELPLPGTQTADEPGAPIRYLT